MESADGIRLAFAAGAARVVVSMALADRPELLRECLAVAGDWLAVGLDPRPDRIAAYPWRRNAPPNLVDLVGELVDHGVRRLVLSHGGAVPDLAFLAELAQTARAELFVAGGSVNIESSEGHPIRRFRASQAEAIGGSGLTRPGPAVSDRAARRKSLRTRARADRSVPHRGACVGLRIRGVGVRIPPGAP